jgi:hypothetical protein
MPERAWLAWWPPPARNRTPWPWKSSSIASYHHNPVLQNQGSSMTFYYLFGMWYISGYLTDMVISVRTFLYQSSHNYSSVWVVL